MSQLWNEILDMLNKSANNIRVKELAKYDNDILKKMEVNVDSVLGQIIANTSEIVVDNFVRVFANGDDYNSHNIFNYNLDLVKYFGINKLIIADDIFGGLFAINNGSFNNKRGEIWYFAPDTLGWDNLEINYADFIAWISSNNLSEFYSAFKWNNFQRDIKDIKFDEGFLIYPFLWSNECDIEKAVKKIVPFSELISLNLKIKKN